VEEEIQAVAFAGFPASFLGRSQFVSSGATVEPSIVFNHERKTSTSHLPNIPHNLRAVGGAFTVYRWYSVGNTSRALFLLGACDLELVDDMVA